MDKMYNQSFTDGNPESKIFLETFHFYYKGATACAHPATPVPNLQPNDFCLDL